MTTDPLQPYVERTAFRHPEGTSVNTLFVLPAENVRKLDFATITTSEDGWCMFQARFQLAPPFNHLDFTKFAITVGGKELRFSRKPR